MFNCGIVGKPTRDEKARWANEMMEKALDREDLQEANKFREIRDAYRRY